MVLLAKVKSCQSVLVVGVDVEELDRQDEGGSGGYGDEGFLHDHSSESVDAVHCCRNTDRK